MLAAGEKRLLAWLAERLPGWIHSDHLAALGLAAMAAVGAAFRLTAAAACFLARPRSHAGLAELRLFDLGGIVGVVGMVTTFVITSARKARALYRQETRRS